MMVGAGKGRTRGHGCGRENHTEMEWGVVAREMVVREVAVEAKEFKLLK
jgi:hypothetical protein